MDKIDIDKLEQLAAQATHLPWKVWERDDRYIVDASGKRELARVSMRYKPYPERAEYIAAACNAVPELIARMRKMEDQNERLIDENNILHNRWETCLQDYRRLENKIAKEATK